MADKKISQLTGATTPLAGTEVLPIVQSGATVKVSVANLTAGRTQTSDGIVQGTAATGYNFTANTPAAGMTSQLLNWYEEGTWTPVLNNFTTSGSVTVTGTYTRIGRSMFVTVRIVTSEGGTTLATAGIGSYISGLPYAPSVSSTGTWVDTGTVAASGNVWVNTDSGMYLTQGWGTSSATFVFSAQYIV